MTEDQILVHHSKQTEMIALTRCSYSKIFIIRFPVKQDTLILLFLNQLFLIRFSAIENIEEMEKPHKNMLERSDIKSKAADLKRKT